ncbi:MAG: glutathione S-transferase N-terminal domain-containing protein [Rhodospirillales bacterium]|nr:glutathione S-transferase N-terminal domain-containing protein [Rhodospirillales bacterium]
MIDLYTWGTPNGRKVSILLEEVGLEYTVHPVNITQNQQFTPEFLAINPNNKIPAIVDLEGPGGAPLAVFESGAILIYLAEKTGSSLLPASGAGRYAALEWLMLQMGGVGPIFGQVHHFWQFAKEDVPYAKERFKAEMLRLYGVLDKRLSETAYLAGDEYSIADIATYPWVARFAWHPCDINDYICVKRWYDRLSEREAVKRGMDVPNG